MADFNKQLLDVLAEIKGGGTFASNGSKPFIFPGLTIKGMEEIAFPVNAIQVNEMIKAGRKAPFGKGGQTVLDTAVRSAWEIDAGEITFSNPEWKTFIEKIVEQIKPDLGIEKYAVTANLYKLLIYDTGDFFVAHKDSEKEKGMFGTLIIGLPSKHTGGELLVRFDGREEVIDFSVPSREYKIPFAAFYADCEHEIKPVTSGHRVCLVYNLVQNKGGEKPGIRPVGGYAKKLAAVLKAAEDGMAVPKIVLLGHQYTPSNFTIETLKLNDRPKAEALIQAAQMAGFHIKLGLVTSYQTGQLEINYTKSSRKSSRRSYYDGYDDYSDEDLAENGIMGEVYDEHVSIEHWMEQGEPPLRNIQFDESNLVSSITFNEGAPAEKQAEGYTGNAGMEMQYWYHYGAVFLWPAKYHQSLLLNLEAANKLEWLDYYNKNRNGLVAGDIELAKQLAEQCMQVKGWRKPDFTPFVNWLINIHNNEYLVSNAATFLTNQLRHITVEDWVKLFNAYPYTSFEKIFAAAALQGNAKITSHILAILCKLLQSGNSAYEVFLLHQTEQLPAWLRAVKLAEEDTKAIPKDILHSVLVLEKLKPGDSAWTKNIAGALTDRLNREYVNDVLMAKVVEWDKKTPLTRQIIAVCKKDLAHRVNNKPQPPANWSRTVPSTISSYKKVWDILADFLQSPVQQFFDYRKSQHERSEMESAINHVTIDLIMETIKKGSPHTLRLTKTQAAYKRDMEKWHTDVGLLEKAEKW